MLNNNRRFFLILVGTYTLIMQGLILWLNKGAETLFLCQNRQDVLSQIFIYTTKLGEWISIVGLGIYLLIKNRLAFFSALIAYLTTDLLMVSMKKFFDAPRPLLYFDNGEIVPIQGIEPLYHHSMPSGHTFTAFFCAAFICFFYSIHRGWQLLLFVLAMLVGFSRMYLMCHFIEDVLIGSLLGILGGVLSVFIYNKMSKAK